MKMKNKFEKGDYVQLVHSLKDKYTSWLGKQQIAEWDYYKGYRLEGYDDWWIESAFELYKEPVKKDLGNHYKFYYKGLKIDVYRILEIFQITNPAQQHAIKKLLRAGNSIKPLNQDIDEVILTLERWKEMIIENE